MSPEIKRKFLIELSEICADREVKVKGELKRIQKYLNLRSEDKLDPFLTNAIFDELTVDFYLREDSPNYEEDDGIVFSANKINIPSDIYSGFDAIQLCREGPWTSEQPKELAGINVEDLKSSYLFERLTTHLSIENKLDQIFNISMIATEISTIHQHRYRLSEPATIEAINSHCLHIEKTVKNEIVRIIKEMEHQRKEQCDGFLTDWAFDGEVVFSQVDDSKFGVDDENVIHRISDVFLPESLEAIDQRLFDTGEVWNPEVAQLKKLKDPCWMFYRLYNHLLESNSLEEASKINCIQVDLNIIYQSDLRLELEPYER